MTGSGKKKVCCATGTECTIRAKYQTPSWTNRNRKGRKGRERSLEDGTRRKCDQWSEGGKAFFVVASCKCERDKLGRDSGLGCHGSILGDDAEEELQVVCTRLC